MYPKTRRSNRQDFLRFTILLLFSRVPRMTDTEIKKIKTIKTVRLKINNVYCVDLYKYNILRPLHEVIYNVKLVIRFMSHWYVVLDLDFPWRRVVCLDINIPAILVLFLYKKKKRKEQIKSIISHIIYFQNINPPLKSIHIWAKKI